jgi:hypothetical protein
VRVIAALEHNPYPLCNIVHFHLSGRRRRRGGGRRAGGK